MIYGRCILNEKEETFIFKDFILELLIDSKDAINNLKDVFENKKKEIPKVIIGDMINENGTTFIENKKIYFFVRKKINNNSFRIFAYIISDKDELTYEGFSFKSEELNMFYLERLKRLYGISHRMESNGEFELKVKSFEDTNVNFNYKIESTEVDVAINIDRNYKLFTSYA